MELIDGIPLEEHLNNLKDKNEIFAEERIWKILMQVSKSEWLLNIITTCLVINKDDKVIRQTDLVLTMPTQKIPEENVGFHQTNKRMDESSYVPNFDIVMTFIWINIVST